MLCKNCCVFIGTPCIYIYIYIVKRFSDPRKEGTPCDGDGKRK